MCGNTVQYQLQVTSLELRVRCVQSADLLQYKETAMVVLACIVVACNARLEALDLRLDWYCTGQCAQELLVRPPWRVCLLKGLLKLLLSRVVAHARACIPAQTAAVLCRQLQSLRLGVQRALSLSDGRDPPRSPKWTRSAKDAHHEVEFSDPWALVAAKRCAAGESLPFHARVHVQQASCCAVLTP